MNNKNETIYIIDALRTPIGKLYGALSHIRPDDLAALVVKKMIQRKQLDVNNIDGIILGCANQAGEDNRNIARMASFLAQLPYSTTAITINSLCSSGMEAIFAGLRQIALGEGHLYIAGGVESMSRSPMVTSRVDETTVDSTIGWRFVNPEMAPTCPPLSMPETAELLAQAHQINREQQDSYAFHSRQKYQKALEKEVWKDEITPITDSKNQVWKSDEQHRLLSLELLSKLPKLVASGQYISSGNAARIGDGAALVALASEQYVREHNIKPLAKVHAWSSASCHPNEMSLAAVAATKKLLNKTELKPKDLDWIEMSEAFAVQALACIEALELDPALVNPNGGALTMGNPISVGAARLVVSLAHEINRNNAIQRGLATTSAGLGTGSALILEQA